MQPEARSVQATSGDRRLTVTTKAHDRYRDVVVRTPRLLYHQTQTTRITFDLPGGKPRSASPIRVGRAYAAFTVWAWGDPGLADVRIVLPRSFSGRGPDALPADTRDQLRPRRSDGRLTYAADDIADPNRWYATVDVADRDALTDVSARPRRRGRRHPCLAGGSSEWLDRVSTVLETSLPDLETAIGLPWPVDRELGISEVSSAADRGLRRAVRLGDDEIQISEELDEQVIVHEAAHAWFNGGLFAQRWISEGLADEYASRVIAAEGRTVAGPDHRSSVRDKRGLPPQRLAAAVPDRRRRRRRHERYGYDASWTVIARDRRRRRRGEDARRLRGRRGADRSRTSAPGPAETAAPAVADWRRFLDLVEELGGVDEGRQGCSRRGS